MTSEHDRLIWTKNTKAGQYTTKHGYAVAIREQTKLEERSWWSGLWQIQNPQKTILTMWLALSNKLLTWEMLKKRGFEGPSICSLCKMNEDTSSHLFALCQYAGRVWT